MSGQTGKYRVTGQGPGRPSVKSGAPITDIAIGILAAMGVLVVKNSPGPTCGHPEPFAWRFPTGA